MSVRGRKKGVSNGNGKGSNNCEFCEGIGIHWGKSCGACDGTGSELVRRQIQKVYNAKNNLPISYNLNVDFDSENYKKFNLDKVDPGSS